DQIARFAYAANGVDAVQLGIGANGAPPSWLTRIINVHADHLLPHIEAHGASPPCRSGLGGTIRRFQGCILLSLGQKWLLPMPFAIGTGGASLAPRSLWPARHAAGVGRSPLACRLFVGLDLFFGVALVRLAPLDHPIDLVALFVLVQHLSL